MDIFCCRCSESNFPFVHIIRGTTSFARWSFSDIAHYSTGLVRISRNLYHAPASCTWTPMVPHQVRRARARRGIPARSESSPSLSLVRSPIPVLILQLWNRIIPCAFLYRLVWKSPVSFPATVFLLTIMRKG